MSRTYPLCPYTTRDRSIGDRVWQPTWTRDLAFNSIQLMLAGCRGRYQMACHGEASFAELAQEIILALGWSDRLAVVPVDAASVSGNELGRLEEHTSELQSLMRTAYADFFLKNKKT